MKQLIIAAALVLTATSAALAQFTNGGPGNSYYDAAPGYYDAAPGYYGAAPAYGNFGGGPGYGYDRSPPGWFENNTERGGPGPRVGAGSGMGVGSQR
jgi:hypothetical protein